MEKYNSSEKARLLVLDIIHGKILAFTTDGIVEATILDKLMEHPDGIAIDAPNRHIYWTNMGKDFLKHDGSIERVDYDGSNRMTIVPKGSITLTPKQLKLDLVNRHLYWCDREGMKVMRAGMDGSDITVLVEAGRGETDQQDERNHCVGIAPDVKNGYIYWSQKGPVKAGKGRIFRAGLELPADEDPASRSDIEVLWDNLPEPIDLELNHLTGQLFWTDRGAPPNGNTLNRASINEPIAAAPEVLLGGLKEAIGLDIDVVGNRAFFGDLDGKVYTSSLDGNDFKVLYSSTDKEWFTGMVYVADGLSF